MGAAMKVQLSALPTPSHIASARPGADFADCYQFGDPDPQASALETYLALVARTPLWMNALMALRNRVVAMVGLKHLGSMGPTDAVKPANAYRPGDRVGIFSLLRVEPHEVILFDDDKHLRVQLSLCKHEVHGQAVVSVSTVVHIHNRLGRVYMSIVGPVHRVIVPRMLAQVTHD